MTAGHVMLDRWGAPVMLRGVPASSAASADAVFWLDDQQAAACTIGEQKLARMDADGRPGMMLGQVFSMDNGQWLVCVRVVEHELGLEIQECVRKYQGAKPASEL